MDKDLVDYLGQAKELGASDVHITVDAPPAARVNGELVPLEEFDLSDTDAKELVLGVLSETQRAKLEDDLELDFALEIEDIGRYRGNAFYARGNLEVALRFIPVDIPELRDLGHGDTVERLCRMQQGLILVTGITGAGKTTTLASMVKKISEQRSCVIITIEDPIEYVFDHSYALVKQRELGTDTKSFPAALRAAMRQDPDVILVSELRDLDTVSTAITAAETGHLVIGTLHTIDAPKSLDRIIDVFPPQQQGQILTQLANSLVAIISQRLIRRVDQPGRVMATEIMTINHGIRACMIERKFEQLIGLMQLGANDGMHTIDDSVAHLLKSGHITFDDAMIHARDPQFVQERYEESLGQ